MISLQSLSNNLLPNVYVKNITLNAKFKTVEKMEKGPPSLVWLEAPGDKKAGAWAETTMPTPTATISDMAQSSLTLSVKFVKNKNFQSDIMQLLDDELSDYIKVYVHQITSKSTYETILSQKSPNVLTNVQSGANYASFARATRWYSFGNFLPKSWSSGATKFTLPEQILDDGTILNEGILNTNFTFLTDTDFLGYIIVIAVNHPELSNILMGTICADILILDGKFQNEGLMFTIAPPAGNQDAAALSKFGKPGDVWAGEVHRMGERFMAGAKHSAVPHPYLNYQIVPASKFVDNRVSEKLERNVINVTKVFEKVNSLTSRYTNSALNLLDFESYRTKKYISEIFLSHDQNLSVHGSFVVDKENLIKRNSAFPFLFDNIQQAFKNDKPNRHGQLRFLLKAARLMKLTIFEDKELLGAVDGYTTSDKIFYKYPSKPSPGPGNPRIGAIMVNDFRISGELGAEDVALFGSFGVLAGAEGLDDFSFRSFRTTLGVRNYKIEVEYKDPTVQYVKKFLPFIGRALKSVNEIVTRAQIQKSSAHGIKAGFDPLTQRMNPDLIKQFSTGTGKIVSPEGSNFPGLILDVQKLADRKEFYVFFYNPEITHEQFKNYLYDLGNINTATLDSLLVLVKYLSNLKTNVESVLAAVGSKPLKSTNASDNQYAAAQNQGDVHSTLSNRVIKESRQGSVRVYEYGYDFTGFMQKYGLAYQLPTIRSDWYKVACGKLLEQLVPESNLTGDLLQQTYKSKGLPKETLSANAFSSLNIPVEHVKSCVVLPKTVVNVKSNLTNVENIFTGVLKLNNLLYDNNTNSSPSMEVSKRHKDAVRKDLNSILGNMFGASLNDSVFTLTSNTVSSPGLSTPMDLGEGGAFNPEFSAQQPPPNNITFLKQEEAQQSFINPNNFILLALLNKLLLGKNTLVPKMTQSDFQPVSSEVSGWARHWLTLMASAAPLQVKALSIDTSTIDKEGFSKHLGPFKNFTAPGGQSQFYMQKGTINPLFLCYYWFIHQNLVRVQYLKGFTTSYDTVPLKNNENPYEIDKAVVLETRNMESPQWRLLNLDTINGLGKGNQLLCRLKRYEDNSYIDKKLVKTLNLPLINNYFVLEGS